MTPSLADLIARATALPDLVYFRDLGSRGGPIEAWLMADGQTVSLRLKRGNEISDHGPHDVLPSGMPADELILAWIDPVARAELKHHGFFVGGFADSSAAGIALAKRFLSQRPPITQSAKAEGLIAARVPQPVTGPGAPGQLSTARSGGAQ